MKTNDNFGFLERAERNNHFWVVSRKNLISSFLWRRILDVGCGTGYNTYHRNAVRIDIDRRAVVKASQDYVGKAILKDFFDFKSKEKFGTVLMMDVLEHMKNDWEAIEKARGLLEPGGRIIITVPYSMGLWRDWDNTQGHVWRYTKGQLRDLLKNNGFKVTKLRYWNFPGYLYIKLGKGNTHNPEVNPVLNHLMKLYFKFEKWIEPPRGLSLLAIGELEN